MAFTQNVSAAICMLVFLLYVTLSSITTDKCEKQPDGVVCNKEIGTSRYAQIQHEADGFYTIL
jgi:hypothetical protein